MRSTRPGPLRPVLLLGLAFLVLAGCHHQSCQLTPGPQGRVVSPLNGHHAEAPPPVPRELMKYRLADYIIEPPDILLIDAVSIIPKPPYKINTGDVLIVRVPGAPDIDPVGGVYPVELDGT